MSDSQWHYETAPDMGQSPVERLRNFPRQPDLLVYSLRSITSLALRAWLRIYHRLRIVGRENLPLGKSFVMVCNHASHLDTLSIVSALPLSHLHRAFPAAAADYFFTSPVRVALTAIIANAVPFYRRVDIRHGLDLCRQLLANQGNILIIFPEGTRTLTGALAAFRPGVGSVVAGTDVPVLPCCLRGAFQAWPKGAFLPRPYRLELVIGAPREYSSLPRTKESAEQVARDLHDAVQELLCE